MQASSSGPFHSLRPPRGQGPNLLPCPSHAQPGPGSQWAASGCKWSRKRSKRDVPTHAQQHLWPPGPWVGVCGEGDTGLCPQAQALPLPVPRAMVQSRCKQVTVPITQLLPSLQSQEQRGRKAAIVILTGTCVRRGEPLRDSLSPSSGCLSHRQNHTSTSPARQTPHTPPSRFQLLGAHGRGLLAGSAPPSAPSACSLAGLSFHAPCSLMTRGPTPGP